MDLLWRTYKYLNEDIADPRTNEWLLIGSPCTIVLLIGSYLYFVFKLGRTLMEKRKPYNLNTIMMVYNVVQVLLSMYIVVETISKYFWQAKPNIFCDPVKVSTDPLYMRSFHRCKFPLSATWIWIRVAPHAFIIYLYFVVKISELLDTVFFILRKKWNQVSPLHVWHHSGMVIIAWVGVKFVPGGQSMLVCALNSFVHIIMYVYYLVLSIKPDLRTSLWWKKYITQVQLTQFAIILIHQLLAFAINCGYPRLISYALLNNTIFIILLFADFYRRAYKRNEKRMKEKI